ncbi:MAG: hypothetical protein P1U68_02295 [Verrucomicrobiales bacterium]|nr:hypothetical protein [Verrucomicrobiales bacterium]
MNRVFWILGGLVAVCVAGCATRLGPGSIKQSHRPYNDSVIETLNEQLLLNLVRLKYRDNPYFIEVSSITSSQSIEGSIGASGALPRLRNIGLSAGSSFSDSPTISYQPLQGEEFIQKLMAPVPIQGILKLTQSGWRIERVMRLAVEQANSIHNAPTASGPTPKRPPEYREFKEMTAKLAVLQETHGLDVALESEEVAMIIDSARITREDGLEVRRMLRLDPRGSQVILTDKPQRRRGPDDLYLQTRSVSGILFFLSHNVEVPQSHIDQGLVTVTRESNGEIFDWNLVTGDLLQVKSSPAPPINAFVKLRYRGNWFYIEDNDLESKSTFMLLNQLFNLLAGDIKKAAPVLTIPVG